VLISCELYIGAGRRAALKRERLHIRAGRTTERARGLN